MKFVIVNQNEQTTELYHYGIKGQKWGIRRFQNPDGTLTDAGRKRYDVMNRCRRRMVNHRSSLRDVEDIYKTLSKKERRLLGGWDDKWISNELAHANIAKRIVIKENDTPVSFCEVWDNTDRDYGEIAIATRGDKKYRGKGYAERSAKAVLAWYDRYGKKRLNCLLWSPDRTNNASKNLAIKLGFKELSKKEYSKYYTPESYKKYTSYAYYGK